MLNRAMLTTTKLTKLMLKKAMLNKTKLIKTMSNKTMSNNTMLNKIQSFSLLELMTVIIIVGLLSAIAIPSYKTYVIKAQVLEAVGLLRALQDAGTAEFHATGGPPSSIVVGGVTINSGLAAYNTNHVKYVHYNYNVNIIEHITEQWYCVLTGISSIPGYVEPTGGTDWGASNAICAHTNMATSGETASACGMWAYADGRMIPVQYLPKGCNCSDAFNLSNPGCPAS